MQVKSIAECSKGSILQYFRPSLSYPLSLRSLFCLFLCGRLRQVLLYHTLLRLCFVVISFIYICTCDINHRWKIKILIFFLFLPLCHAVGLRPSINRLVTDRDTKLCCWGYVLALFQSTAALKIDSEHTEIIQGYSRYGKLKYYKLQ